LTNKVGLVGLGNMGGTIARQLAKQFHVIAFDVDQGKREQLQSETMTCVDSLEELAAKVNVILFSLPRADISLSVLKTISPHLAKGSTIIETSTVLPSDMLEFEKVCKPYQINLIDAAILGGVSHMANRTAALLIGDPANVTRDVEPVLLAIAAEVKVMGTLGAGMAAKVINNAVAHSVMGLIVEAAALGVKLGISVDGMYELLRGETALLRPLTHRFGERIMNGNYEGGMSLDNARKDSILALELAQQQGVPLFNIQSTHTVYEIAKQEGYGHLDYAAIAKLWEKWVDIDFTGR